MRIRSWVKGWRIRWKMAVPFTALVMSAVGVSAAASLYVFNRYTERDVDASMRGYLNAVASSELLDLGNWREYEKAKTAFGVDLIGSNRNGHIMGTTLDRTQFKQEDHARLEAALKAAYQNPSEPRWFNVHGRSYRMAHEQIPFDRNVELLTMTLPFDDVEAARRWIAWLVAAAAMGGAAFAALTGRIIARAITAPIEELAEGARGIADGDLTRRVKARSEDEVGQLAEAFNEMADQLLRSREQLAQQERLAAAGQMAATFAHEIRNPLSSIRLTLQLAAEKTRQEEILTYIENGVEEIDRLNAIVERTLDFARPPRLHFQPINAAEALRGAVQLLSANFRQQRIQASAAIEDEPILNADEAALKQALLNVLLNAAQAQPDGGEIAASLRTVGNEAQFVVEDGGPGFSEEALEELFNPFFTTKTRGSGLGLTVVKRILDQHGGYARIENRAEGGALVLLSFPLGEELP